MNILPLFCEMDDFCLLFCLRRKKETPANELLPGLPLDRLATAYCPNLFLYSSAEMNALTISAWM